jgi:hypothetical protein
MLLRLSHLSLWLATAAAVMAFFGPAGTSSLYGDIALALGGGAFVLWRGALAMRRRLEHPADAVPAPRRLDDDALGEAAALAERAAAAAGTFDAALLEVGDVLRGELGARSVHVFLVSRRDGSTALSELIARRPGFRAPRRAVAAGDSVVARALRELRACVDLPRAVALPVVRDGAAVALLELTGIEMPIDDHALGRVLDAAVAALVARGDADSSIEPDAGPQARARGHFEPRRVLAPGAAA